MLKNMKIKKSLILGFGVTTIISALLIVLSLFMMNSLSKGYQKLLAQEVEANQIVTTIRLDSNVVGRNVRDMALIPDDPANADMDAACRAALADMETLFTQLSTVWPLDDASYMSYYNAAQTWSADIPTLLDYLDRGDVTRSIDLIYNTTTPNLNAMASIAQQLDNALTDAQNEAVEAEERAVTLTIVALVVGMIIAIAVVLLLATKLIRSIVEPTEQVHRALVGFSEGKLDIPVEYESKNELGEMCDALRTSQKVLMAVIQDACRLLEEMGRGNFDVKTQAEK